MSILKYIDRLKLMDSLIRRKATGNSFEFAKKIGISRSVLMENINEMRAMGVQIEYDKYRNSYYYSTDCRLVIEYKDNKN